MSAAKKPKLKIANGSDQSASRERLRTVFKSVQNLHTLLTTRDSALRGGGLNPPGRNLEKECGYPEAPSNNDYLDLYARDGFSKKVVDIFPDACFAVYPDVYETDQTKVTRFERAWAALNRTVPVIHFLHRVDRLSGRLRYGAVLLGLDDGPLNVPVQGVREDGTADPSKLKPDIKLHYMRAFGEEHCRIATTETSKSNPRYGQPTSYDFTFSGATNTDGTTSTTNERVHWSRVIHVADNRESSEIYGVPRMQPVLNYLLDLRKVGGSSAEMFWKGGFPGWAFEQFPELSDDADFDEDSVVEQLTNYMNGLQRYMAAVGGTWKSLAPQVADPSSHVAHQISMIGATIGVPSRKLLGAEAGHLASTSDTGDWNGKVLHRQRMYVEPMVIRPTIDRLQLIGVLPPTRKKTYVVSWTDLNTITDKERADIALKKSQAMMQYVTGKGYLIVPPREFVSTILGLSDAQAEAIILAAGGNDTVMKALTDAAAASAAPKALPQGGGREGNPPKTTPNRPPKTSAGS